MTLELQLRNTEVLAETEKLEIEKFIEHMISIHKNNRSEINKLTMESVTCLAVSDSRASELADQGFFKRSWNNLTGVNKRIRADIDRNVAKSQYAAQQTIQKLAEQNLLTFDLVMAVNNKLNTVLLDIDHEMNQVFKTLVVFFKQVRSDMLQLETRLEKIERNVNLLHWKTTIEYQSYNGQDYTDLHDIEKLVCVLNDFYTISKGEWNTFDLMLLKAALAEVGLNIKGKISYRDFFMELIKKPELIDRLFQDVNMEAVAGIEPYQASLIKGIEKTIKIDNEERYIYETIAEQLEQSDVAVDEHQLKLSIVKQYLKNTAYTITERDVNLFDFSMELLINLQMISGSTTNSGIEINQEVAQERKPPELGDFVEFGVYKGNRIIWQLIDADESRYLLFSHRVLDVMPMMDMNRPAWNVPSKWGETSIQMFLNSEHQFLREFTFKEIDSIFQTKHKYIFWHKVRNGEEHFVRRLLEYNEEISRCLSKYETAFKLTSKEQVFLLSIEEIVTLLRNKGLEYRLLESDLTTTNFYWTRDHSTKERNYAEGAYRCIYDDGRVGQADYKEAGGVRPALYIKKLEPFEGTGSIDSPFRFIKD